jgi:hypothetical protein
MSEDWPNIPVPAPSQLPADPDETVDPPVNPVQEDYDIGSEENQQPGP